MDLLANSVEQPGQRPGAPAKAAQLTYSRDRVHLLFHHLLHAGVALGIGSRLNGTLTDFIKRQPLFMVATADRDGRVNVSPKGMDTLRIKSETRILWLNLSGSGNETAAHVAATGRMTLMFCAFDGQAMILRVYGQAKVFHPRDAEWGDLVRDFPPLAGSRQIFALDIDLVQTSCGSGVPIMEYKRPRADTEMIPFYADLGPDGVAAYWRRKNTTTIDGKPTGVVDAL
jgi:Pyridoxamine 5'-phosphate oxidase